MNRRRQVLISLPAFVAACTHAPMAEAELDLRLSPASLGRELALQQRMTVRAHGQSQQFEIGLEADSGAIRLAVLAFGQTVARLEWDGRELREERVRGWPSEVRGAVVLRDLQLVHWPAPAIESALPPNWRLQSSGEERVLLHDDRVAIRVQTPQPGITELQNFAQGYVVRLESSGGAE